VTTITADECLYYLSQAYTEALSVGHSTKNRLAEAANPQEKYQLKVQITSCNNVYDFSRTLMDKINRSNKVCHKIYDRYQKFLDNRTSLQCIHFYQFLRTPQLAPEFARKFVPRHKLIGRDLYIGALTHFQTRKTP
jgi:hypothetical protein